MAKKADISIDGRGFYQINGRTCRGLRFMDKVEGNDNGTAFTDDSTCALNIADGAIDDGLTVEVNGKAYTS